MIPALFTLALAASATAFHIPGRSRHARRQLDTREIGVREQKPIDWWVGLEEYHTYHIRYMAVSCYSQHNTTFFDDCCHPLLKTETLAKNRKAYCAPSAQASSSASAVEPSRSVSLVTVAPAGMTSSAPAPSATAADDDEACEDEEEEDDEDCDDEESSAAPSSTHAPTSTKAPSSSATPTSTHVSSAKFTTSKVAASTTSSKAAVATPAKAAAVEAAPTTTKAAATTSSKAAESTSGSSSGLVTGGQATYYEQGGVAGACGDVNSEDAAIVAIAFASYGDTGKKSSLCGKKVQITNLKTGTTKTAKVADACQGCSTESLDMSTGFYAAMGGTVSDGVFPISWKYLD